MTIGSVSLVAPALAADRDVTAQQGAIERAKAEPPPKAPFDPLPALRPTLQDKIEITRALMELRNVR